MRNWYRQDPSTDTSGQVAVAVISERPVAEIIQRIGHTHHTTTRELARVLVQYGFLCPGRCVVLKEFMELPRLGIAQVHSTRSSRWHWVAFEDGRIFDGTWGDAYGVVDWPRHFRMTSYLPIED